jgi:SAM-dependent methyltransferase/4-amino-4-deoxy-L-arabinose transferase-like glycosyltransferase
MVSDPHSHSQDDLLWRHLKSVPAFRAVLRAVEARFYRRLVASGDIQEPVLDIGCGDGHFAQMAFDEPLAAGIDPWWGPLRKARRAGAHRLVIQGMGNRMPFADGQFATVVSNSVLEHIPDVQPVLDDANRVLQPGGKLIFTTPSHYFTKELAGAALLEKARLSGLADRYRRLFNFVCRHQHTDAPEVWAERLAQAGFIVEEWQYYFSRKALWALEVGHAQGLPSAIMHFLTGHWILAPWRSSLYWTERWLRPFYEEGPQTEGAYLLFVARKVNREPVRASLPAASAVERQGATQVVAAEHPEQAHPQPQWAEQPAPPSLSQVPAATGRPVFPLGAAAVAAVPAAVMVDDPAEARPPLAIARGRSWLLLPALFLVLLAYRQVSGTMATPRPSLALLLWLAGSVTAVYGLSVSSWRELIPQQLARLRRQPTRLLAVPLLLFGVALALRLVALSSHPFMLNGTEANIGLDALGVIRGHVRSPFSTGWLTNPTLLLYLLALPLDWLGPTVFALRLPSAVGGALSVAAIYLVGSSLWSRPVGLVAAFFLAASHWHLHYSRLGMTNIWDPLLVLLALGTIAIAWQRGTAAGNEGPQHGRAWWLLAGLFTGLSAYFYTSSHLMPLFLGGLLLWWLLFDRAGLRRQAGHMLAGAAVALLVALPQIMHYREAPTVFMDRARTMGIVQSGWLAREAAAQATGYYDILAEQWWQAALAFIYTLDKSSAYNPGIPLLGFWPALFFAGGVLLALAWLRQLRYAILLIWLLVTVTFAGALLESPPNSFRLLVAAPAAVLLAAVAFVWLYRRLVAYIGLRREHVIPLLLVLAFLATISDPLFYFGRYRQEQRFGDPNTEIAYEVSRYLNTLEGEWTVYFHGPPHMYADFPTMTFLAPGYRMGANLFNVAPEEESPPMAGSQVFLYVPQRSPEAHQIQLEMPGGKLLVFRGRHADPLFYTYEVR